MALWLIRLLYLTYPPPLIPRLPTPSHLYLTYSPPYTTLSYIVPPNSHNYPTYISPILPLIPHLPTLSHPFPTLFPPISQSFYPLSHVFLYYLTHFKRATFETMLQWWKCYCKDNATIIPKAEFKLSKWVKDMRKDCKKYTNNLTSMMIEERLAQLTKANFL
jgi:hypothetical protein